LFAIFISSDVFPLIQVAQSESNPDLQHLPKPSLPNQIPISRNVKKYIEQKFSGLPWDGIISSGGPKKPKSYIPIPPTHYSPTEQQKARELLSNKRSWIDVDTPEELRLFFSRLDDTFGPFRQIDSESKLITYRGRFEYQRIGVNPSNQEKGLLYVLSDPRVQYKEDANSEPIIFWLPYGKGKKSGFYAEITLSTTIDAASKVRYIDWSNVVEFNLNNIPNTFMDFSKLTSSLARKHLFSIKDQLSKQFTALDFIFSQYVAGENSHDEVKGSVTCNVIKTSHDRGLNDLEAINEIINTLTHTPGNSTIFERTDLRPISPNQLTHVRDKFRTSLLAPEQREMDNTRYKNGFSSNLGWSLNRSSFKESEQFIDFLPDTNIDIINPILNIDAPKVTKLSKSLKSDNQLINGSKILFLTAKLHPIQARISDLQKVSPRQLRVAAAIQKMEYHYGLEGDKEPLKTIKLDQDSFESAAQLLKKLKEETTDFILRSY